MKVTKLVDIEIKETRADGGRIVINTRSVDRDRDRVLPEGAETGNYQKNPVVQWGHNYWEPWATVGKTTALEIGMEGITASFDLRPAANDQDPQNIVRLLWEGGWIRTASIGFNPLEWTENEMGGRDFTRWELLEWSLVPVPANQDALRLAAKSLGLIEDKETDTPDDLDARIADAVEAALAERLQTADADADDEPDTDDTPPANTTDDDELTPEEEAALVEALETYTNTVEELIGV